MKKQLCSLFVMVCIVIGNEVFPNRVEDCTFETTYEFIVTKCGNPNGEVKVISATGMTPIMFTLSNGDAPVQVISFPAVNTFSNLASDLYQLTGIDNVGCTYDSGLVIDLSSTGVVIDEESIQVKPVTCNGGNDGEVKVTASGGTPPLTFTLDGHQEIGDTSPFTATFTGLFAGSYIIMVTDKNGCTDRRPVTLSQPRKLTATITVTSPSCDRSNGIVTVDPVSGGTSPYQGCLTNFVTNGTTCMPVPGAFMDLPAGEYGLTITDDKGCTFTSDEISVQPSGIMITDVATKNPTCNGFTNGSIAVTVVPSPATLQYELFKNGVSQGTNTTGIFDNLSAGAYKVEVTDIATGCKASAMVELTDPAPLSFEIQKTDTTCGENNGAITFTNVQGGTPPYMYSIGGAFQPSPMFTGLGASLYLATVRDNNDCTTKMSTTISASVAVVITDVQVESPTCPNFSDGSIMVSALPVGPVLTYQLSGPVSQTKTSTTGNVQFNNVSAGLYMIQVSDETKEPVCSDQIDVEVPMISPIKFTQPFVTPVTCKGLQNGTILLEASQVMGGTPPYTYSIGTNAGFIPVGDPFVNLAAGVYMVTVRDANGCESMPVSVMVLPGEKIKICSVCTTPASCGENNGTLTVVAKSVVGLQYSLNGGPFQNSPKFINLAPGTYRVVVNRQGDNEGECATCCAKVKQVKTERKR